MTAAQLAWLAASALLVFWMVGAYNRLVGLRNAIASAWTQLDEPLRRRGEALAAIVAGLRERVEPHALEAIVAAQQQLQAACAAVRAKPVNAAAAASLGTAERVLASALARLAALLDGHSDVPADVDAGLRELHDAERRCAFGRQLFNDAVDAYNAAARQFPTRVVAHIFGLGPGGRI